MAIDKVTSASITDGTIATADIADSAIATAKIADSAVTSVKTSGVGEKNTPAFATKLQTSGDQDVGGSGTWTKLNMTNEIFDEGSCFDTTNKRFLPTTAGKYMFHLNVTFTPSAGGYTLRNQAIGIYKNGSLFYEIRQLRNSQEWNNWGLSLSGALDMNGSSDYAEAYVRSNDVSSGSTVVMNGTYTNFCGYLIAT
tara:strand:+ start:49 stop:636 length:588 start_codon:yes stop_codon:yes gene_type:complete